MGNALAFWMLYVDMVRRTAADPCEFRSARVLHGLRTKLDEPRAHAFPLTQLSLDHKS